MSVAQVMACTVTQLVWARPRYNVAMRLAVVAAVVCTVCMMVPWMPNSSTHAPGASRVRSAVHPS
jgi:hypothetical protein